jgi:hypothetical protein
MGSATSIIEEEFATSIMEENFSSMMDVAEPVEASHLNFLLVVIASLICHIIGQ